MGQVVNIDYFDISPILINNVLLVSFNRINMESFEKHNKCTYSLCKILICF